VCTIGTTSSTSHHPPPLVGMEESATEVGMTGRLEQHPVHARSDDFVVVGSGRSGLAVTGTTPSSKWLTL
jgi:hypothetical protein